MNPVLWMQLLIFFGTLLFTKIQQDEEIPDPYHNLYLFASLILIAFGNLETVGEGSVRRSRPTKCLWRLTSS